MNAFESLLNPEIENFILENENADTAQLALKKPPSPEWPYKKILSQIRARQKAQQKLPSWLQTKRIVFPPPDLVEQASSEATAHHKSSLFSGNTVADLTAGTGVDFTAILENFQNGIALDANEETADLLRHNLPLMTNKKFKVRCAAAEDAMVNLPACDLVYIDPQRRSDSGKGKFRFQDCSPDIVKLLPALLEKSPSVMIKASPVLDIDAAVKQLGHVNAVHVVEWRGDCREVLYICERNAATEISIRAVAIDDKGTVIKNLTFTRAQEKNCVADYGPPENYLFEPSAAFQKAGGFKFIAAHYNLRKLHAGTHLYTGKTDVPSFPGRRFEIAGIYPATRTALPVTRANLTVRNFPTGAETLRHKLKLKDGGTDTLFACTLWDESLALIHALKT